LLRFLCLQSHTVSDPLKHPIDCRLESDIDGNAEGEDIR
jgi:hypothetical protein